MLKQGDKVTWIRSRARQETRYNAVFIQNSAKRCKIRLDGCDVEQYVMERSLEPGWCKTPDIYEPGKIRGWMSMTCKQCGDRVSLNKYDLCVRCRTINCTECGHAFAMSQLGQRKCFRCLQKRNKRDS